MDQVRIVVGGTGQHTIDDAQDGAEPVPISRDALCDHYVISAIHVAIERDKTIIMS